MSDGGVLGAMENCDLVLSQRRETRSVSVGTEKGKMQESCFCCHFSPHKF